MKYRMISGLTLLIVLLAVNSTTALTAGSKVFHVPRIEGIIVDGSSDDWGKQGFRVEFLADPDGRTIPTDDFDVKFRLGWSQQGLLILVTVRDDVPVEHENLSRLWQRDCVEIFLSKYVGSTNRHQVVLASGADSKYKTVRQRIYDWRLPREKTSELTAQSGSGVFEGGYVIEALLPWENLGVKPYLGMELGFQFVANDYDGESGDSNGSLRVAWFYGLDPSQRFNMYRMSLSQKPSEAVLFRVNRKINLGAYSVSVQGSGDLIGEMVVLRSADEIIAQDKLKPKEGRASVQFNLNPDKYRDVWPQIDVAVGGKTAATFEALSTLGWILERYIQAVGGRAAIEKLTTRVCTGRLVDDLSGTDPPVQTHPLKAYAKIPDKWITILEVSKGIEQNGFDGTVGWKQNPDRIERSNRMSQSWLGYLLNPQGALHIQDYFPGMTLETKDTFRGRIVYMVKTPSPDETQNRLYFDAETGLLNQIGSMWELQDYREVDGIKFPFRIATSRKGGETYFAFHKVEHNLPVDDRKFAIPEAADVFADAFKGIMNPKVLPMLQCKDFTYVHEDMNVPCRDGRFLYDFIIKNNYKRGLEIGTFTGYSALWMGLAFQKTGGKVTTVEYDSVSGQEAKQNFRKAGLEDVIDSRINDAFKEIPKIEGKFDFVFIDAWKPDYIKFLRLLKDRILPGGAIIAHNVTNHARDMREFLDAIKNDPNLETTFNEISAEGMSVSIVRKKEFLKIYSELKGDYEFYLNDRYVRLTVYVKDGSLMVDERGYPHLTMESVDLGKLEFKATDGRRQYRFRFNKEGGKISTCVWERGKESLNGIRYNGSFITSGFTEKQLQEDFKQMRRLIENTHPIMYEFTNKDTFDKIFNRQYRLISDGVSLEEFYRIAVPFVEKVGCAHTNLWMPEGWLGQSSAKYFPLKLRFIKNKAYLLQSNDAIPAGSQILSINGLDMSRIMMRIQGVISADGFNESYKFRRMEHMFPFQFAKQFGYADEYIIRFVPYTKKNVKETILPYADFKTARRNIVAEPILEYEVIKEKNTAVLKINNFNYYRQKEKFFSVIDRAFNEISAANIENLILDLRGNNGGDPFCAAHLFSYIAQKPTPYFSKPYGKYKDLAEPILLAENRFSGNLYILTDGMCISTTGHLCGLLKHHKFGTFIGEETGATYTCNDAKDYLHLRNTRIQLWVATGSFAVAVEGMANDRSIIPDFRVEPRIGDLIKGRDTVMEFAHNLINK